MKSKHIYFVRHGESEANATDIRFDHTCSITQTGRTQAKLVGERLCSLDCPTIVSSPFTRTKETAEIIAKELGGRHIQYDANFIERRNPSFMTGTHEGDESVVTAWNEIEHNYGDPHYRHSDEENFSDILARADRALEYLERFEGDKLIVVSHGLFMKVIMARVLLGNKLDGRIFWDAFIPMKNVANTGIMHLEYGLNYHKTASIWKLVSWNDHSHLEGGHAGVLRF